ncbi:hypothetical protein [Pseudomonas sp. FEN]|nr:hypothetical protein [Pseudomonas sp. FEN]
MFLFLYQEGNYQNCLFPVGQPKTGMLLEGGLLAGASMQAAITRTASI